MFSIVINNVLIQEYYFEKIYLKNKFNFRDILIIIYLFFRFFSVLKFLLIKFLEQFQHRTKSCF